MSLPTTQKIDFYQNHLNQVSRSFALTLSHLRQPLRNSVTLAYLLFRAIDTIEDCPKLQSEIKIELLKKLKLIISLKLNPQEKVFSEFKKDIHVVIDRSTPSEAQLLLDFDFLWSDILQLSHPLFFYLQSTALEMIDGLIEHLSLFPDHQLRLNNLTELNHYCFYVAGLVGRMLNDFVGLSFKKQAIHFGLFLQKVNILKDQAEDAKREVYYFDNQQMVTQSMIVDFKETLDYIDQIPSHLDDYKLFCLFSATLGIISVYQSLSQQSVHLKRDNIIKLHHQIKNKLLSEGSSFSSNEFFMNLPSFLNLSLNLNLDSNLDSNLDLNLDLKLKFNNYFNFLSDSIAIQQNSSELSRYTSLKNYSEFNFYYNPSLSNPFFS